MRVIAGKFRSRPLDAPPGADVRPTSDKLRGTLFNVLTAALQPAGLEGTVWLDVYAGSGAIGIEALSRGARQVYFVESARRAGMGSPKNLQSLQISNGWAGLGKPAGSTLP